MVYAIVVGIAATCFEARQEEIVVDFGQKQSKSLSLMQKNVFAVVLA
jgi:L-lactate utilization protein LutC